MSDQVLSHIYTEAGTFYPQATCGGYTATFAAGVTVDPALPAPAGLAATADGSNAVDLTWDPVVGADSYVVTYWPTANPAQTQTVSATTPAATVTGLTASTEYAFSVHAVDASGAAGEESAPVTATTAAPQLPTPQNLTVTNEGASSADTSWSPVASAANYTVSWALAATPGTPVGSQTVTATSYQITGLTADTDYIVSVTAHAPGATDSEAATVPFSTLPQLAPPAGLATSNVTATGAQAQWTAVSGATGYTVTWALTSSPTVPIGTDSTTSTSFAINDLTASTGYTVSVVANDSTGASADSEPSTTTFTTTA